MYLIFEIFEIFNSILLQTLLDKYVKWLASILSNKSKCNFSYPWKCDVTLIEILDNLILEIILLLK